MKNKTEFSKFLLKQEAILIWILSLSFIVLAFYCIHEGFTGSLPWLAAMVGFPWTAYGVSQACYYKKSMAENTEGGIKFETVVQEARQMAEQYKDAAGFTDYFEEDLTGSTTYAASENIDEFQI